MMLILYNLKNNNFCPKIYSSISIKSDSKQSFWRKNVKFGNAKKVAKAYVAPVLAQNVCDSSSEKEICVRFSIAISAFRSPGY